MNKIDDANDKNFFGLELVRFLCAVTIILWHYQNFFCVDGGKFIGSYARDLQPFHSVFAYAYNWGNYAVEVFWALSGFIFFWKYALPVHDGKTSASRFFVLRFSRLYPLHFLTLVSVLFLQQVYVADHGVAYLYEYNDVWHFILNLFMASDWGFHSGLSFNGPIWSISVEILAYAVFFLLARRYLFTPWRLTGIIVGLIVAKMALPWVKDIVLCQLYFFVGGAVHLLSRRRNARPRQDMAIAVAAAVSLLAANWATDGKVHTYAVIAVAIALISMFLMLGDAVRSSRVRGAFICMGNMTYASYLIHFPVQIGLVIITDRLQLARDLYFNPVLWFGFVLGVFALAWVSFRFFERPAQQWIRAKLGHASGAPCQQASSALTAVVGSESERS